MTPDVVYVIVALSLAGGILAMLVAELVDAVWAGRRRYPRGGR